MENKVNKLSELLNITQPQYSRVENALTDPTKYLNRLADIFGCAPKEVFSDENLKGILLPSQSSTRLARRPYIVLLQPRRDIERLLVPADGRLCVKECDAT